MQLNQRLQPLTDTLAFLRGRPWLLTICLLMVLAAVGMGLTNPVVSLYAQSFGVSTSLIGFFITTFAIGRIAVTYPAGQFADRWGRRPLVILGPFIVLASALGLGGATTYTHLLIFRFLQGVGSALTNSAAFLAVADLSPPEERGRVTSLFQGSLMLGLTIGPAIGGGLAEYFGLRAPFYATAVVSVLVGLLALWQFPESLRRSEQPAEQQAVADQPTATIESEAHKPQRSASATRKLLSDSNFILIVLIGFIIFMARSGSRDTIMPLVGYEMLGLDAGNLGAVFTMISALNFVTIPLAGMITDKLGRKPAIILGLGVNALAIGLVGISSGYTLFIMGTALMGVGKGFGEPSSVVYVTDVSPRDSHGTTYGLFLTLRDVGLLIGPILLGSIADLAGLRWPLIFNAVAMAAIAVIFALAAKETLPASLRRRPVE